MVRKFCRVTIIIITTEFIIAMNNSFAEITEDIMSEIMSNKSVNSENDSLEQNSLQHDGFVNQNQNNKDNAFVNPSNGKLIKKNLPLSGYDKATLEYNKGIEAVNRNQEIEAAAFFKKAIEEFPGHHKSRLHLIQLYQKIGWNDEIEKILQKGLDLDPEHKDFIKNLALLYQQKGQNRKALSVLLTMPDHHAHDADYLALLALAYLNADQADMAEKYYQLLLKSNKENPIWWLGLAICQNATGDYQNAVDSFSQAKNLGRFNTETLDYINNQIQKIKDY